MGVANDLQMNYLDRNWVSTGDGFDTITNVVGGDPTLTGNFGISSLFIYQDIEGSYMAVSPGNIDFGVIQIADGAVTADVTINNYGNEDFDVTDVTVVGDGFSTALATPVTVAAGTAVTMDVTFTPTVAGPFAGTITITGTADNTTTADVNASIMVFDGFPDYFIWTPAPTSSSGAAFMESFGDLGYTAYADPNLFFFGDPLEAGFDAVFICLGIFSDNYSLMDGSPEVTALMAYADAGNPLYMEGGDTWAYDTPTALHSYFNIDGIADGSGDLTMVDGAGLWPDLNYEYLGGNSFIDHLAPLMVDAFVSHINPADGEARGIANLSPSINTLGNSFEFGGLVDAEGPRSTKTELLAAYLDFLAMEYTDLWPPDIGNVTTFTYTLDTEGPYTIEAVVMDNVGVNSVSLFYNADAGAFTEVVMTDLGGGVYTGDIPGYPVGTTVGYYVFAADAEGNEAVDPEEGVYVFDVVSHLPPMYPQAESGLDGTVELEWVTPGDEFQRCRYQCGYGR